MSGSYYMAEQAAGPKSEGGGEGGREREWRGKVITCDGPSPQLKSLGSYEYHF